MLRVTIELLPEGMELGKQVLGVVEIANDVAETIRTQGVYGNYNVTLYKWNKAKDGKGGVWKRGRVVRFPRKVLGSYDLLYRALRDTVGSRNPTSTGEGGR